VLPEFKYGPHLFRNSALVSALIHLHVPPTVVPSTNGWSRGGSRVDDHGRRRDGGFPLPHRGSGAVAGGSGHGPPSRAFPTPPWASRSLTSPFPHHRTTTFRPASPPPARRLHPCFPPLIHLLPSIKSCSVPQERSRRRTRSFPLPILHS
jgi:hypothetical protein